MTSLIAITGKVTPQVTLYPTSTLCYRKKEWDLQVRQVRPQAPQRNSNAQTPDLQQRLIFSRNASAEYSVVHTRMARRWWPNCVWNWLLWDLEGPDSGQRCKSDCPNARKRGDGVGSVASNAVVDLEHSNPLKRLRSNQPEPLLDVALF